MRNHTAKPFEARSTDYICVGFQGNNRVFVKDNHSTITKVNRIDVTPIEMDIKIAELFNESRKNSKIRAAQLAMPTSKMPAEIKPTEAVKIQACLRMSFSMAKMLLLSLFLNHSFLR